MTRRRYEMDYDDFASNFKVENGKLIRILETSRSKAGDVVGYKNNEGYLKFRHKGKIYAVHRVIYLLAHGECPECVDHINGVVSDNRIENLRGASNMANLYNSKMQINNKTGCKGVHLLKDGYGYQANINYNGKRKFLGTFKTFENAKDFITLAREMVHGKFANHGVAI